VTTLKHKETFVAIMFRERASCWARYVKQVLTLQKLVATLYF